MSEDIKEYCGLFGIWDHAEAARICYFGLYALQHRGQESAGIATTGGGEILRHRGMGLVPEVFQQETIAKLANRCAIGHTRYSTTGATNVVNAGPLLVTCSKGQVALAHNGNLTNSKELRDEMEAYGSIFQTSTDSEIMLHLLAQPKHADIVEGLCSVFNAVKGAFSILVMTPDMLVAVRDPNGFRPLCIGKLGSSHVFASETCAFDLIQAEYLRDVQPGEMVIVDKNGMRSETYIAQSKLNPKHCIFEHIYFARPDSKVYGESVHAVRKKLGARLAQEHPAEADIVIPVPDSGNSAALGYAEASGIPLDSGFIRNHYVGRTFIQPEQFMRDAGVEIKLNVVENVVRGKRVVVVDDSLIRGTTSKSRVKALRRAGAKEIHLRISCPPTRFGCYYGIDFPDKNKLIASTKSVKEIAEFIGADSLGYVSLEGMLGCMSHPKNNYCTACFSGEYPVAVAQPLDKFAMEGKRS